ncbi:hypothetical protein C4565_00755 [Candidatus Parcubacteria bacterium]|nr:MAG: hypothetical protein C4565_00755 [Candidatus Parcubacteria bacterium]
MSILDSIKADKKISFNHWRYRILHWTFNIKNPTLDNYRYNGLPLFLYTHYCPLFHLTNLIAILSPIVLAIKVLSVVFLALVAAINTIPFEKIVKFFERMKPKLPERKPREVTPEEIEKQSRAYDMKACLEYIPRNLDMTGEGFYAYIAEVLRTMKKEEVVALFNELAPKFKAAKERAVLRKKKWRERIIFWTNFSRVFLKWAMNIAYVLFGLFTLYGVFYIVGPVFYGICWLIETIIWLFTDTGFTTSLWLLTKIMALILVTTSVIFGLLYTGIVQRFGEKLWEGLAAVTAPLYILGVPLKWIKKGFDEACEFVSMFYEENCPPVVLVSKEEAQIESIAQNGEEV